MTKVKICGITSADDARTAVEAGADAIGLIFFEKSPRCVDEDRAAQIVATLPPFVEVVGLFVNAPVEFVNATADRVGLDIIQLSGDEEPLYCQSVRRRVIKSIRVKGPESLPPMASYRVAGFVLDAYSTKAYGGTGEQFNWDLAVEAKKFGPILLAGGLNPDNVAAAVAQVSPYGVDVASGVELSPGVKDPEKVKAFIRRAKVV